MDTSRCLICGETSESLEVENTLCSSCNDSLRSLSKEELITQLARSIRQRPYLKRREPDAKEVEEAAYWWCRLTPTSVKHMSLYERFHLAAQAIQDLHHLAQKDGCVAAAWAYEMFVQLMDQPLYFLTRREFGTVIGALQYYAQDVANKDLRPIATVFRDCFTDDGKVDPMDSPDIADLCEALYLNHGMFPANAFLILDTQVAPETLLAVVDVQDRELLTATHEPGVCPNFVEFMLAGRSAVIVAGKQYPLLHRRAWVRLSKEQQANTFFYGKEKIDDDRITIPSAN